MMFGAKKIDNFMGEPPTHAIIEEWQEGREGCLQQSQGGNGVVHT